VRALFCGQRTYTDRETIFKAIMGLTRESVVIHGGAKGADYIAHEMAIKCGLGVEVYFADWKKDGKAAGPIRNQRMIDEGKPDIVYAFFNNRKESRGTEDMIRRAEQAGIPVVVFEEE